MADIFEIAEGFRAALLKNERAAAVRLVKAYGAAWNRISADLAKLNKQIDAARSRGEVVDQWWLIRQERYRSLLDQITREMSRFADFAESQITAEQRRAIAAARNDAQRLMIAAVGEAPEAIAPNFNRLPASAVENLAGFLSNGSPLNRLLGEFAPSARQQIEQGLMSAIAQGWGARKTATAIRKALGGNLVRALRIARTETIRAYRETTHRVFQANADVMDGWYWLSARNRRTCFPAGALITTLRGNIPIEKVQIGDFALTHKGRFCRVRELLKQSYNGEMVTVVSEGASVTATADHLFAVAADNGISWVEAGCLQHDHQLLRLFQCGHQDAPHFPAKPPVEITGANSDDLVAGLQEINILSLIAGFRLVMPIRLINLKREIQGGQKKVYGMTPTFNDLFLLKRDILLFQNETDVLFWFGFSGKSPVATGRTKTPRIFLVGLDSEIALAGQARKDNGRATTNLRAVSAICFRTPIKCLSATGANSFNGSGFFAGQRAMLTWDAFRSGEPIAAMPARKSVIEREASAFYGAVTPTILPCGDFENLVALLTFQYLCGQWWRAESAMRKLLLVSAVAEARAKAAIPSFNARWSQKEFTAAFNADQRGLLVELPPHPFDSALLSAICGFLDFTITDMNPRIIAADAASGLQSSSVAFNIKPFHKAIITETRNHTQPNITVFNLEVDEDESYVVNGFVVHNCPTCWALHGTFHPITERLAGHVQCRCTQMPRPKSLAELGFPGAPDTRPAVKRGEDLFDDQPADVQQQVLGAAFAAYKDGRIKLTDLVGRKESPQWGASYYTLGVGRALNNEGRFPGYSEPPKPAPSVLQSITPRRALSPAQIALIRTAPAYRDPDGIPDPDKIAVESLGLMHANPFPPKLKNRAQKAGVALDQITLGRPALDRERLLRAAEALAQEIKAEGKGIEPIRLAQRPDGSFVVSGDGNHRIAALKLLGYEGEIPALVRYQKAAPIAAGRKAKAAGEGVASTGGSADAQAARAQMKQIQRENKKQVKEIYAAFDQAVKDEAAAIARGDFAEAVRLGLNRPRLLAEAERVRNGLKEQQRAALYQETESEFKIAQPYARFIEWDKGVSAFRRLIGKGWLDGEEVRFWAIGDRERAYYEKGEVNVQTKASAGIVVHELGHWLEDSSPKIFNEVTKFLQRRTKGEKAVPLKQFNKRYDADEETRPDKFLDPYMGKVYETNGKRKASEVVSMGLELFYNDPAKLAEKDPDFFDFIYDLVRNRP